MEKLNSLKSFENSTIDLANEEDVREVLEAQVHIWNHILSFINSMSLKCAIELGIFETIHKSTGGPVPLSKLSSDSAVAQPKSQSLHRLMRILAHAGFIEIKDGGYLLTKSSKLLLWNNPFSAAPFLTVVLDPAQIKTWDSLAEWFRSDDVAAAFGRAQGGVSLWEHWSREPGLARHFNEMMACDSRLVAGVVVGRCGGVFDGVGTLVDVGGGTGTMAAAVAAAFPLVDCVVLDLPHVVAEAAGGAGPGRSNLRFVGGDMFDEVPPGDAIMLKWVLHDWSDEDSLKILRKCKDAILKKGSKKGKVIIIDIIVENDKADHKDDVSFETKIFFDMSMMVLVNGKERNENEWAKLFEEAGFTKYNITPILGLRSLIEVYP